MAAYKKSPQEWALNWALGGRSVIYNNQIYIILLIFMESYKIE